MNSLIKKGILVILALVFATAVLSGCGAKTVSAPIRPLGNQTLQNGGIQVLTTDGSEPETTEPETTEPETTEPETTEPETTEPESTEPETTEPEATEPEAPAEDDLVARLWAAFLEFFDWFRIRVNYFFEVLMEEA